jgi:hypothetical protein
MNIHLRRARRRRPRPGSQTALCLRRALLHLLIEHTGLLEKYESWRLHMRNGAYISPGMYRAQEILRQTEYLEPR